MNKSESIKNLAISLSKFQAEIKNPANTATNPFFKSKYAPLDTVLNTVRPILSKHGLSVLQVPTSEDNNVTITTILLHESGEFIESEPLSLKMDKVTAQGAGSAITYARRYAISAMLGISSEDDDDGNNAEPKKSESKKNETSSNANISLSGGQIKRLYAIGYGKGYEPDDIKDHVRKKFNKEIKDLTKKEYDNMCNGYKSLTVKK